MSKWDDKARERAKNSFNLEETIRVQEQRVGSMPAKRQFLHINKNPSNVTSFEAAFNKAMDRKTG